MPWPFLELGHRVLIERGPLAGVEGILDEVKGKYRLVVSVQLLQRSVSAEVDRDWIRPLPPARSDKSGLQHRGLHEYLDGKKRVICICMRR